MKNVSKTTTNNLQNVIVNATLLGKRSKFQTPPFLLNFEIFNQNAHNFLVDSGASCNVISYSICKKLNVTPKKCFTHIIQLDRSEVKVI
jgi:hypothetical protein